MLLDTIKYIPGNLINYMTDLSLLINYHKHPDAYRTPSGHKQQNKLYAGEKRERQKDLIKL